MSIPQSKDVAAAINASPVAKQAFEKLPLSHEAEYLRWVDEAKKPKTRQRRIASMIERLSSKESR